jgi:ATP-dependent protease HslVU (ClpYQ) ATPase subunit
MIYELCPFFVQRFDSESRGIRKAHRVMRRIGLQLIGNKMRDVTGEKANASGTKIEEKGHDKDLLSLMIKSNISTSEQRLRVDQILHQIPTFLAAGKYHVAS